MPLTGSAVDVLGVATLVLVLLLVCAGLGCIAYVLYFRARIRKERLPALQVLIYNTFTSQFSAVGRSLVFVVQPREFHMKLTSVLTW